MLLHDIVGFAALKAPDSPALVFGESVTSFAQLDHRIDRLAGALQQLVPPRGRVAIVSENVPAWIDCYYAVPRAGLILTFLNHRLSTPELSTIVASARPTVLLASEPHLAALRDLVPHAFDVAEVDALIAQDRPAAEVPGQASSDVAWLLYTSGTTGLPKGAMLTHDSVLASVLNTALGRPVAADDVYLFPFPLCHVAGYNVPMFHLHRRPVVLLPRFDAAAVVAAVREHSVTTMSLAPTMISTLVDHLDRHPADLPTLRSVGYGASGIAPSLLRRGMNVLGAGFNQGYGMTELSGNGVFLDAEAHRRAADSEPDLLAAAGRPGPLLAVRVLPDGEIAVRGDQVMAGYWEAPEANAEVFVDGWFRTGDLGRFDDEGYLYVVDRKKDVIVTGGENVSSREVEDALMGHPAVADAAAVGVPDAHWGENVCAVVVVRDGMSVDENDLVAFARDRLAGFKKPKHVVFVDELPRNASGKVLKHLLRQDAATRLGR